MDALIRTARPDELVDIIELYRHLNPEDDRSDIRRLERSWGLFHSSGDICCHGRGVRGPCRVLLLSLPASQPHSRGGRSPLSKRNHASGAPTPGLAFALLREAIDKAWRAGCYKVVLKATGSARPGLYERLGFAKDGKYAYEIAARDACAVMRCTLEMTFFPVQKFFS